VEGSGLAVVGERGGVVLGLVDRTGAVVFLALLADLELRQVNAEDVGQGRKR
jgi:hypothetical protein